MSAVLNNVDLEVFPRGYIETIGLMIDLVALAKRDFEFHVKEQEYIKEIGKALGFTNEEIFGFMDLDFIDPSNASLTGY